MSTLILIIFCVWNRKVSKSFFLQLWYYEHFIFLFLWVSDLSALGGISKNNSHLHFFIKVFILLAVSINVLKENRKKKKKITLLP